MTYITKNLRKGKGKFKRKLPLKCFRYGAIRHFAMDYQKRREVNSEDDDELVPRRRTKQSSYFKVENSDTKGKKKFFRSKGRNFLSKLDEENFEEESDDDSDDEATKDLLVA